MSVQENLQPQTNGNGSKQYSPFLPRIGTIIKTEQFTPHEKFFRIEFTDNSVLNHCPGQFVEVSVLGVGEVPISISSSPTVREHFDMCIRSSGGVTNAIHKLSEGDTIMIRGPYGNGYPLDKMRGKDILIVAGGLGIIPLRSLINYLIDRRHDFGRIIIICGFRTPADILFKEEIIRWQSIDGLEIHMTVDKYDGYWKGNTGLITRLFSKINVDPLNTYTAITGPPVMYKFVLIELFNKNILPDKIFVSLERRMKCGIGKCGHCQINNKYTCIDGPVFNYDDIARLEEAL